MQVTRLPGSDDLPLPEPATAGSAGLDLRACLPAPLTLAPGAREGMAEWAADRVRRLR